MGEKPGDWMRVDDRTYINLALATRIEHSTSGTTPTVDVYFPSGDPNECSRYEGKAALAIVRAVQRREERSHMGREEYAAAWSAAYGPIAKQDPADVALPQAMRGHMQRVIEASEKRG